jgi:hypothetical protein
VVLGLCCNCNLASFNLLTYPIINSLACTDYRVAYITCGIPLLLFQIKVLISDPEINAGNLVAAIRIQIVS